MQNVPFYNFHHAAVYNFINSHYCTVFHCMYLWELLFLMDIRAVSIFIFPIGNIPKSRAAGSEASNASTLYTPCLIIFCQSTCANFTSLYSLRVRVFLLLHILNKAAVHLQFTNSGDYNMIAHHAFMWISWGLMLLSTISYVYWQFGYLLLWYISSVSR